MAEFDDLSIDSESLGSNSSQESSGKDSPAFDSDGEPNLQPGQAERGLLPYLFEPVGDSDSSDNNDDAGNGQPGPDRRENADWCLCGNCQPLDSQEECICCQEIAKVQEKMQDAPEVMCITDHPGFQPVVLDLNVLQTAYYNYRQQHGPLNMTQNNQYRYVAYRQLTRWCWAWLGRRIRVILPSCAVNKILQTFPPGPDEHRTGYRDVQ